jgi:hypothetical protein
MKICWDNIENLYLTKGGNLKSTNGKRFYYFKICKSCGKECLVNNKNSLFCSVSCGNSGKNNGMYGKKSPGFSGRKHSKETKEKMSLAQYENKNHFYGKRHSKQSIEKMVKSRNLKMDEIKIKLSKALKGKLVGNKNPFYGKKHSEKVKKQISLKNSDGRFKMENNPNWKGGKSFEPYCIVFTDKKWRNCIYERDKDKFCWNPQCNGIGKKECLHHIDYNKKNCDLNNIIKVCNSCNSVANFNREWWEAFYKEIMRRRFNL